MAKLKPCPICGGIIDIHNDCIPMRCTRCGATFPVLDNLNRGTGKQINDTKLDITNSVKGNYN